ncbi:chromate efflux transporter [Phenylobacterium sp.]|jgi:chromate transporter|uniref:chromate efflux transporter n=1 Tax=Phenylobacterium sp. TaxID=1871053 RepID=UPI002E345155|nr:chromate efflux transporter [Phenylobacterium sp.]HEX3366074.1 chromate efflux transporter [Phenylobacterium sp.]
MKNVPAAGAAQDARTPAQGSPLEVLQVFTWLGMTCFGGPIAHLGYFRREFVDRRKWLTEHAYADLVGLCQFLPGPASSKVGYSLGLMRAGYLGGLAAFVGFTLPSAILLVLFAYGASSVAATVVGQGLFHGLKLTAVAIVAQAVWGMAVKLCPDRPRALIATAMTVLALLAPTSIGQIAGILVGGLLGLRFCRSDAESVPEAVQFGVSRTVGVAAFVAFAALLGMSLWPQGQTIAGMFSAFYRSGALVFGGGHVVLPLLTEAIQRPGWVTQGTFLAGYGAAQAVPGPLFTFATYLGAVMTQPLGGLKGAALATVAVFLPGLLLQTAALPFWNMFRGRKGAQAAMRGVNAAVVGILAAALYARVFTPTVTSSADFAIAATGFVLLTALKTPPLVVVALSALSGVGLALLGG